MIEVTNLRVVYPGGVEALRSVSLTVRPGEIVALVGQSGSGKSTLLRAINGLQPITSGRVLVDGIDLASLTPAGLAEVRRRVGFIWQEFNVVRRLSAFKNVLTGRLGHRRGVASLCHIFDRRDREIAVRSLERVRLLHRAQHRADRLSGGEKQRVAIARALAQQPTVLLADEPVASLDVELAWQVMRDLAGIAREEGVPTLISLHDVAIARAFADRVVALAGGRLVLDVPAAALDAGAIDAIYQADAHRSPRLAEPRPA